MKNKFILAILFLFSIAFYSYSQIKKTDYLKYNQLYLTWNNHNINFSDIKPSVIIKLLGKPIKIEKEKSEVTDAIVTTYIYSNGEINMEGNSVSFITIKKAGWAFTFKKGNVYTKPFTIGTNSVELTQLFPYSSINKKTHSIQIPIKTNTGIITESSIIFEIDGSLIKTLSLFTDES